MLLLRLFSMIGARFIDPFSALIVVQNRPFTLMSRYEMFCPVSAVGIFDPQVISTPRVAFRLKGSTESE